jgi:hypothetical protein
LQKLFSLGLSSFRTPRGPQKPFPTITTATPFYTFDASGYTDYPFYSEQAAA